MPYRIRSEIWQPFFYTTVTGTPRKHNKPKELTLPSALFCEFGNYLSQYRKLLLRELSARLSVLETVAFNQRPDSFGLRFGKPVSGEHTLMLHAAKIVHRHIEDTCDRTKRIKRRYRNI